MPSNFKLNTTYKSLMNKNTTKQIIVLDITMGRKL
jgi:hypothetical protein